MKLFIKKKPRYQINRKILLLVRIVNYFVYIFLTILEAVSDQDTEFTLLIDIY